MASADLTRIAGNIGALNALNSLENINKQLATHQARLASGKQINSAADDPAGLTIATKMLARSEGLKTAQNNIGDALNMMSVAEGGLSKMNDILVQMRSKAEQAASDTLGVTERQAIQTQLSSYAEQIDNIVNETKWNGVKLLDGTVNKQFQTGADVGEVTNWQMSQDHSATALNISSKVGADQILAGSNMDGFLGSVTSGTVNNGLTKVGTGTYQILNLGVAATSTVGNLTTLSNLSATGGAVTLSAIAKTGPTEAVNGTQTIEIVSTTTAFVGGTTSGVFQVKVNGAAAQAVTVDKTTGNGDLGNGMQIHLANTVTALSGTASVDYIQADSGKFALQNGDGTAVAVDADGINSAGNNPTSSFFYAKQGTVGYQTGRGLAVDIGNLAAITGKAGTGKATFSFAQQSNYSVDVSTASAASNEMGLINTAMDTVNASLSTLGSLEARMGFKSDQTSVAQSNVEASYNRIMNADMAQEQVQASKFTILQQVATSMLAQANAAPQSLLSLFR